MRWWQLGQLNNLLSKEERKRETKVMEEIRASEILKKLLLRDFIES